MSKHVEAPDQQSNFILVTSIFPGPHTRGQFAHDNAMLPHIHTYSGFLYVFLVFCCTGTYAELKRLAPFPQETFVPILWSISSTHCNKLVLEVSRVRSPGSPLKTWLVCQYRTCNPGLKIFATGLDKTTLTSPVLGASLAIGSPVHVLRSELQRRRRILRLRRQKELLGVFWCSARWLSEPEYLKQAEAMLGNVYYQCLVLLSSKHIVRYVVGYTMMGFKSLMRCRS